MKRLVITFLLFCSAGPAFAECNFDVEVGDSLQFNLQTIEVEASCASVTINLNHTGKLPAAVMGHNWVLSTEADRQDIAMEGAAAGLEGNYLPADDPRVIAATPIIGGGESTSVSFPIDSLTAGEDYTYFCSFPGHWAVMIGTFKVKG